MNSAPGRNCERSDMAQMVNEEEQMPKQFA